VLRDRAGDVVRRATAPRGTIGLALSQHDALARVKQATAQVDSIRTLLSSDAGSFGRFRRDSTLLRTATDLRNELAIAAALFDNPRGTAGRVVRDSAIVRQVASAQLELDLLIADIKARPLRYWPF